MHKNWQKAKKRIKCYVQNLSSCEMPEALWLLTCLYMCVFFFLGESCSSKLQHTELFYTESEATADPLSDRRYTILLQTAPQQQRRAGAEA